MQQNIRKLKKFSKAIYWLVFAGLIGIAGIVALSALNVPGSLKLLSVQSGSMEPSIPRGSVILIKPEQEYKIGNVITFKDKHNPNFLVTHRIVEVENLESGKLYVTKGDANEDADRMRIASNVVQGKVFWALPFLGYAVSFARTQMGLILLIVIPTTLIIYSELLVIKKELKKLKEKSSGKTRLKRFYLPKLLGIVILIFLYQGGASLASLLDTETSIGNTMTAGVWGVGAEEDSEAEGEIELMFYLREDDHAVGFVINGVSGYDSLDYAIDYERDPGVAEHIEGSIDNSGHTDVILREWFELGTCSTEGLVCDYHEGIGDINLTIDLFVGAVPVETLHRTITLLP